MKVIAIAHRSSVLGPRSAPVYAQEQHEQEARKTKPEQEREKSTTGKAARQEQKEAQEGKTARPEEENSERGNQSSATLPAGKAGKEQHAAAAAFPPTVTRQTSDGSIAFESVKATIAITASNTAAIGLDSPPWPSNWLYTQDVYVVEIDGVYYLCNPAYPGVNVELNVTL